MPPNVAQQIATDPAKLEIVFKKLKVLAFGGGNLTQTTGDTLARHGPLFPIFGSTENGLSLTMRSPGASAVDTWACMDFHPKAGYVFRPTGDGRYEAVIVRSPRAEDEQPVFKVFPQLDEWSTKDLFTPHATIPGVWIYESRSDDIITFADATSFNPLEYEMLVSGHPSVRSALMLGSQRQQACLLIESEQAQDHAGAGGAATALDELWPLVSQANESCTKQSAVLKSHVFFTSPLKPLPKGFKGSVQRAAAARLYADEMEALYCSV